MPGTPVYSVQLPGTPLGTLKLWATDSGLRRVGFRSGPDLAAPGERLSTAPTPRHLARALELLAGYLEGRVRDLGSLPLDMGALTDFQLQVYRALRAVPYGRTTTYGRLAEMLGLGAAGARAVGQAVGANPVAIVVPCHRVVGADGALHGYAWGLERKAALLRLEGISVDGARPTSRIHPEELTLPL
ncbi:MAG: methylated-DNA--[protein]-cysteine S-methyltransferase [Longimicrobiales bacterium]|nr:methylated-DNA--[protein]-cysteine S-methyltransferase [Longimicrobiales bacterium]